MKSLIRENAPGRGQILAIGLFNTRHYRRRGGSYRQWRNYLASWDGMTREALQAEQARRLEIPKEPCGKFRIVKNNPPQ